MRIRTQLVLVCFLLSVLPLTGIVVYSYYASRRALESAYHAEAKRMAAQMDRRLGVIRNDLEQRLAEVSALPSLSSTSSQQDVGNIIAAMGDAASFVDSIEIQPMPPPAVPEIRLAEIAPPKPPSRPPAVSAPAPPPPPAPPPAPEAPRAVAAAADAEARAERAEAREEERADRAADKAADKGAEKLTSSRRIVVQMPSGRANPAMLSMPAMEPIVIDIPVAPKIPRFVMSAEQRAKLDQIRLLARQLQNHELAQEQRSGIEKQLDDVQKDFNEQMQRSQAEFQRNVEEVVKEREQQREIRNRVREELRRQAKLGKTSVVAAPPDTMLTVAHGGPGVPTPALASTPAPTPTPATPRVATNATSSATSPTAATAPTARRASPEEVAKLREHERQTQLVLGQRFNVPLRQKGKVVASISAHVSTDEIIRRVLGTGSDDRSEVAFAVDRQGKLYTRTDEDRATLERIGVPLRIEKGSRLDNIPNWIVSLTRDPQSGLRIGVARPLGENFEELRNTAAKNFGYGMALVIFALAGIMPIASHMTRDVQAVTRGAERIAQGDLMTRLPVTSRRSEFGQLAGAFNRMAEDLSLQQQRIVTQERERQEQAMHQRLLEAEYSRKSDELEEARRFQLSLLPKQVPQNEHFDVAVFTRTATEVGGDYYDFHVGRKGVLSAAIGDATGHGARAGTMVTVVKALFAGYSPDVAPSLFLRDAAEKVKRMDLPRMAMALLVARLERGRATIASAGMPPAYVHRAASGMVDEIVLHATPLGTLGADYRDAVVELAAGDTMLLMSDGFPELQSASGAQLGYPGAVAELTRAAAAADAAGVIAALEASAQRWHGDGAPNDDVTFVVVRARA
jgi:serine phosphatase RsbU (regulator of sigma subunit)